MTLTDEFDPNDAIIEIDPLNQRYTVDPSAYILGVLMRDWQQINTDGMKPNFNFAERTKDIIFNNDWCVLYMVSEIEEPVTVGYNFSNITYIFTLEFYTKGNRNHLTKMMSEARRVLLAIRKDTFGAPGTINLTGRHWFEWDVRGKPYEMTMKGMYRRSVDCRLNWRMRPIET